VDPDNSDRVYVACGTSGGRYRGFYRSEDGGLSWENAEFVSGAVTDLKIDPGRSSTLYAAAYRHGVYQTVDAGANWVNIGLSEYVMTDLSLNDALLTRSARSGLRDTSAPVVCAGTQSGLAAFSGGTVSGYILDQTTSVPLYPASVWLDLGSGRLDAMVFDSGAYLFLAPPPGSNYVLHCSAPGFRARTITNISVGAGANLNYDFALAASAATDPAPDIKVNGNDGPVTVAGGQSVRVTVALDPGAYAGRQADWWVQAKTPFSTPADWYSYVYPTGWQPGRVRTVTAPLMALPEFEILDAALPAGTYVLTLAVDDNADGVPDFSLSDSVQLTVQ